MVNSKGEDRPERSLNGPVVWMDDGGTVTEVNDTARAAFGDAEGASIGVFVGDETGTRIQTALSEDGQSLPESVRGPAEDGTWVEWYLFESDDGAVALGRRRSDEELLREDLEYRSKVLEALPVPVYQLDKMGRGVYFNPAYTDMVNTLSRTCSTIRPSMPSARKSSKKPRI